MNRETKANQHFVWILITIAFVMAILLIGKAVYGQTQNNYGIANFADRQNFPKDGLIFNADFLSAQPMGDSLGGLGDFETGATSGGCTYCPTSMSCICTTTSNLTQETLKLYKNNASLKQADPDANNSTFWATQTFKANTAYQISFKVKGNVGLEDFAITLRDSGSTDYYNFTAHTWGGASTLAINNITTSWVTKTFYVAAPVAIKTNYMLIFGGTSVGQTIYYDDLQIRELRSTGPHSGPSNVTMTVNGDPAFDSSNAKNSFKGQPGNWGTSFNGTTDGLIYIDAGNIFNPCYGKKECKFTAAYEHQVNSIAATSKGVFGKYSNANLGWELNDYDSRVFFEISDDGTAGGGHYTGISSACLGINRNHSIVGTYKYLTDGTSVMNLYCDNNAVSTSAIANGPIFNSPDELNIGSWKVAAFFPGNIYRASFYNRDLDAIDSSKWRSPYFPGNNNNRGFYVSTCTQAASHATCSWDTCRDGTPHACQAEETGSMAIFDTKTELIPYNSFETVTGDDSAPTFTGWIDSWWVGTAGITAYRDETNHGNVAARLKVTATIPGGSYAILFSNCITVSSSTAYYLEGAFKALSGTPGLVYFLHEYSDGACASQISADSIYSTTINNSQFTQKGVSFTTTGSTNSVRFRVYNTNTVNGTMLVDSVSLKAGSYRTPWVHNPGPAGSVTYSARDYRLHNVLTDPTPQGTYPWSAGFCVGGWIWTDWAGDDGVSHGIFEIPPTAGSNNRVALGKNSANEVSFSIFDSAGLRMNYYIGSLTNTKWTAGGYKYIEGCTSNTGTVMMHYYNANNSTWYTAILSPAGTGIQDGQTNYINIGYTAFFASYLDGYISNFFIAPYNATYTNTNFNGGVSPKKPY